MWKQLTGSVVIYSFLKCTSPVADGEDKQNTLYGEL